MTEPVRCTTCGKEIETCAGCQEPECQCPTCFDHLNKELGQRVEQPHGHGG